MTNNRNTQKTFGNNSRGQERPSALARAMNKFVKHRAAERIAKRPSRITWHYCAANGESFFTQWRKASPDGLYIQQRRISYRGFFEEGWDKGALYADFDVTDFAWASEPCPVCAHPLAAMFCHCGKVVCGARSNFSQSPTIFRCAQICGIFPIIEYAPAATIRGITERKYS